MCKTIHAIPIIILLLTVLAPTPSVAAGPPDPRFGAIETYDAPAAAADMGAGWTRIPFLWARMQPTGAHEWLPPISDEALAQEIAQGRQLVGLVITTPGWATDMNIGPGVPYGLHTGHNDPANLWANFLRQLVRTYAGRVDHWIIWNEPDVWDPAHPGYTWGGSVEDFFQLQRVAYMAIKETSPNATVIFSGTSYWWDAAFGRDLYFRRYLDVLVQDLAAPGNSYYCDAVALHVYFQPEFVYSITALYHQLMREHGFEKPVWIVETNAAPTLDPQMPAGGRFAITLDEQAAYIIQAFAMGIAGGAARIGVFKMIDTPTDLAANPEPFGLVRADGSRRPAFTAYQVAATYLAGFQSAQLEQRPDANIVTVSRNSGVTTVLWARTPAPTTVQVPARSASATLVDMGGNRRTIAASGGVFTVQLPGAPCTNGDPCIIGGPPYLIVEGTVDTELGDGQLVNWGVENSDPSQSPIPNPAYTVNLRPIEIKGARDVWRKRGLPGYQIELIAGPPYYLYQLTVVNDRITAAQRSLEPVSMDWSSPIATRDSPPAMTTLYNRRDLAPFTVAGLFDRVKRYYDERPVCDTQVTVRLNGDWAFPRQIIEQPAAGCETNSEPASVIVVAFATLTPTPTPTLPPTAIPLPPAATATPTAFTPTPFLPASAITQSPTAAPQPALTEAKASAASPLWLIFLASAVVAGVLIIRRNGRQGAGSKK